MAEGKDEVKLDAFKGNATIVVLGASGDLAMKKTFPALFTLFSEDLLPKNTNIIGYARSKMSNDDFRTRISSKFDVIGRATSQKAEEFKGLCEYVSGAYDEASAFQNLLSHIQEKEKSLPKDEHPNRLFYLALPPSVFGDVAKQLRENVYSDDVTTRVIIEKPFGHDLESSRELQRQIEPLFNESEIYRIDHYLGKEMVKNMLIVRFANLIMSSWWNNNYIQSVQISFKEPFGTEGRSGYFDDIGIVRDVMQNHLIQVLCLTAMERPQSFSPEDIRGEKVKVLKAISEIKKEDCIIAQYDKSSDGSKLGYRDDETLKNKDSKCPTYAAMVLRINNERWKGVPFILKAGKALDESKVEVRIQLRHANRGIFSETDANELVLRVQPKEAIYMKINAKFPGLNTQTVTTDLDLSYNRRFSNLQIPGAYESLLLDCLNGDHSNFVRDDELDEAWRIFTPVLHKMDAGELPLETYAYGSRGPASADKFVQDLGYVRGSAPTSYSYPAARGNL